MNYPKIIQNPLLKKKGKQEIAKFEFSNMKRPVSAFQEDYVRPFSTKEGGETLMHKRKLL
jgi:hypothetical protein